MKLSAISLAVFLVASLFAGVFILGSVHAQPLQYGSRIDHIRFKVIKAPTAQRIAMLMDEVDVLPDLIQPADIEALAQGGKRILSTPGDHFCYIAFNMRPIMSGGKISPFGPQSGGEPGSSLRHAIAHLVPKTVLIGSLFKYIVTLIHGPMAECIGTFGADLDAHPFDTVMAENILLTAGYTFDGSDWYAPGSVDPIPSIDFLSPTQEAAPTSWTIAETVVQNMQNLGLTVTHTELDLSTIIDRIDAADFDMYFLYWEDMGRFGDHLYNFFHSNNDFPKGYNRPGVRNATLDPVLTELYTTLNETYMEEKVGEALELLVGTSAHNTTPYTDGILPYIPIYSRTYYNAHDENLMGVVNAKMDGTWNGWTASNMYWSSGQERMSDLFPGKTMVIFCQGEDYQYPANPLWASSVVTWDQIDYIYDDLIGMNPYSLGDRPGWLDITRDPNHDTTPGYNIELWTVTDGPAAGEQGMKVTFYLNTTVDRHWHDGHLWDAYDVAFAWEYLTANKIPRPWSTFQYLHHVTIEDASTITAYMTATSIVLPYGLSTWSTLTPEHIWGNTFSRGGRAVAGNTLINREDAWNSQLLYINTGTVNGTAGIKPHTDDDWNVESGLCVDAVGTQDSAGGKLSDMYGSGCVLDNRDTPANEILDYNPAYYTPPTAASSPWPSWLTEQIGTGPFVFYDINVPADIGDLIAFDESMHEVLRPGVHYPRSVDEIHNLMIEYFWEIGDVDKNGHIRVMWDSILMVSAYGYSVGEPGYNPDADLNQDGVVDIFDVLADGGLVAHMDEDREVLPGGGGGGSEGTSCQSTRESEGILSQSIIGESPQTTEPTMYVDPPQVADHSLQTGALFSVDITIAAVTDLMGYDFRLTFNSTILNVVSVTPGDFFGVSPVKWHENINNAAGFVRFAVTSAWGTQKGESGNGRLATIEFQVMGYGSSSLEQKGFTKLATSKGKNVVHITLDGYFRNMGPGDANGDGIVDIFDIGSISAHWYPGPPIGPLGYGKDADINYDGSVDIFDIGVTSANWGNTYP